MKINRSFSFLGLLCLAAAFCFSASGSISIAHLPASVLFLKINPAPTSAAIPAGLIKFADSLFNGTSQPAGIYVDGLFAFKIIQQPADRPVFVSDIPDTVTQFRATAQFHSLGLLAHNTLAGQRFFALQKGQQITVINGDGSLVNYQIEDFQRYQALTPSSTDSAFIDWATYRRFTAGDLFQRIYGKADWLVLQTCISSLDAASWGRYFVLAKPVRPQ